MLSMVTSTRPSQATCFSYFTPKKSSLVSTICCVSTIAEAPISHSTSISSLNVTRNNNSHVDANSTRRSGNYKPTTWDFEYIQSIKNDYVGEEYMDRFNKLKKEMQKMLLMMVVEDHEELDQLKLIDNLQRLGVSYHFKEEIMQILRSIHHKSTINADVSLYSTALKFRLLRERGFDISQDILNNFKDEDGNLKESSCNDTNGLLELYEASFFSTETETDLKNATSLTVSHLKKYLHDNSNHEENDDVMVELVQHALELPRHWMMQRLETIWYINIYERMSNPNHLLLELAKLDFNIVQEAHQQELRNLSRWWNSTCLAEKLPFSRDRLVENSFCAVGIIFEPRYSYCRRMLTKVVTFITIIDDIYDVYGTLDELELFTDAVERWEIKAMEQLPEYMKVCYLGLFNTTNEMAYEVLKEQGINIIPYLKKTWSDLCKAYIREARWYNNRYTPTLEEYMDNAWISIGVPLTLVHAFIFVTHPITKESLESISKYPDIIRHSGIIFRLADDLGTSSEELKRGDVPKSIQCYMNEKGATEEEAREGIRLMIKETWELMNKHTRQKDELFSETFIGMALNMLRMSHSFYQHGDGHGIQNSQIIDRISKILLKPISIPL